MANYKFKTNLSTNGIEELQKQLNNYVKNDLIRRTQIFIERLADIGIYIAVKSAEGDSHHFDEMVTFEKKIGNMKVVIVGRNDDLSGLHTTWYDGEGNFHDETISPILALEYGTAGLAIKGHQGSFAVTGNHVSDTEWYYYEDVDGEGRPINPHYATAEEAHEPMFNAYMEMKNQIKDIARKVFHYR
jgi:hypothetical protein